jgi:hypothetical protein
VRDRRSVYPTPQFTVCPDFSDAAKLGDTGKINGFKRLDRMMQPSNSEDSPHRTWIASCSTNTRSHPDSRAGPEEGQHGG